MIIGITGETSVGKTTVANFIKKEYSASVVHLDEVGKSLYTKPDLKKFLQTKIGQEVLDQNNNIDLVKLRKLVFANEQKLNILNQIMFPQIYDAVKNKMKTKQNNFQIIEGSVLFQLNLDKLTNQNILIESEKKHQIERSNLNKKMNEKELFFLLKNQQNIKQFKNKVDFVVKNNGSIKTLQKKIEQIINKFKQKRWI